MKKILLLSGLVFLTVVCILNTVSTGCKKETNTDNNNTKCKCWTENWLIGTWEGTTPSAITPFSGTKIRIIFQKAHLQVQDAISGNPRKVWTYSGTFTWDVDGAPWSMNFDSVNYPLANTVLFECLEYVAIGQTVNNVSLRIGDLIQVNPLHTIDLDWGPVNCGTQPTYIDFYGNVDIDTDGVNQRAEYPPEANKMIRLTKK